jgi:hypothetical protein
VFLPSVSARAKHPLSAFVSKTTCRPVPITGGLALAGTLLAVLYGDSVHQMQPSQALSGMHTTTTQVNGSTETVGKVPHQEPPKYTSKTHCLAQDCNTCPKQEKYTFKLNCFADTAQTTPCLIMTIITALLVLAMSTVVTQPFLLG